MRSSFLAFIVLGLGAAACASGSSGATASASSASASASAAPAPPGKAYMANLNPTGSTNSRLTGSVTLTPTDANNYNVTFDLRQGPKNGQLPWAIRPGACGDQTPNSEIGGRGVYSAITTQTDGTAHSNTRIHVTLPDQVMHVDVMASNSQRDVVYACGLLSGR